MVDADPVRTAVELEWAFRRLAAIPWMVEHGYDAGGDIAALEATAKA